VSGFAPPTAVNISSVHPAVDSPVFLVLLGANKKPHRAGRLRRGLGGVFIPKTLSDGYFTVSSPELSLWKWPLPVSFTFSVTTSGSSARLCASKAIRLAIAVFTVAIPGIDIPVLRMIRPDSDLVIKSSHAAGAGF
jgi:hypothetical protein